MKTHVSCFLVWILVLLMASCKSDNNYTNIIPKDASLVMTANLGRMAVKGGLTDEDGKTLSDALRQAARADMTPDEMEVLDKILSSPEETGLDFGENIYLFSTERLDNVAILAAVSDYGKLKEFTSLFVSQGVCKPFTEEGGHNISTTYGQQVVMFDDNAFLLLASVDESRPEELKIMAERWFSATKDESYTATEEFDKIRSSEADVAIAGSLRYMSEEYGELAKKNIAYGMLLKDVWSVTLVNFEKGKLRIDFETLYKSDAARELFKLPESILKGNIKGKFLDEFAGHSFAYTAFTLDGEKFYDILAEYAKVFSDVNTEKMPVDVEKTLCSLNGEIAIALARGELLPQMALYAEVNNDAILRELDAYKVALDLVGMKYSVEDDVLCVSNMDRPKRGTSLEDVGICSDAKDKLAYFKLDVKELSDMISRLAGGSVAWQLNMLAEYLKSVTVCCNSISHSYIELDAVDTETNALKQIIDFGRKVASVGK